MLGKYIKEHKKLIIGFFILNGIFIICGNLYHQPAEAILYPVVICLVAGGIALAADYVKYRGKCSLLWKLEKSCEEIEHLLPEAQSTVEEAYQNIIDKLENIRREELGRHKGEIEDMLDYYAVWVHQIKTPISSMKLQLEREDSPLQRNLSKELFRIEQYVEMVLVYLRMNSDYTDYVFKEYDVDKLIKNVVKKFSMEFILKKITLNYKQVNYKAVLDEKWFSFVLEQIISNSLKYTDKGSVSIYMIDENLYIEDTGIGISPEDTVRVFEKGYTGYNGRADNRSTGLGLYLCKTICDNLGIDISIESEIDKGTKVKLNLHRYEISKE